MFAVLTVPLVINCAQNKRKNEQNTEKAFADFPKQLLLIARYFILYGYSYHSEQLRVAGSVDGIEHTF